jgi:hypothetical protein
VGGLSPQLALCAPARLSAIFHSEQRQASRESGGRQGVPLVSGTDAAKSCRDADRCHDLDWRQGPMRWRIPWKSSQGRGLDSSRIDLEWMNRRLDQVEGKFPLKQGKYKALEIRTAAP